MTALVVLTVIVIAALIAGLAVYLYWAGTLLDRIGAKLEGAADIVRGIAADAELIGPGVEHINETGGVVAGALPLLYGMAEGIVAGVTPTPPRPEIPEVARPASGTRRSRLLSSVGYKSELSRTYPPDSPAPADTSPGGHAPPGHPANRAIDLLCRSVQIPIHAGSRSKRHTTCKR